MGHEKAICLQSLDHDADVAGPGLHLHASELRDEVSVRRHILQLLYICNGRSYRQTGRWSHFNETGNEATLRNGLWHRIPGLLQSTLTPSGL